MPGEGRVQEFLTWVSSLGVTEPRLADYRRIASDLVDRAGKGRITESHILHLIDTMADKPGGREATSIIEEVGEALLRFQASRPVAPPPLPPPPPISGSQPALPPPLPPAPTAGPPRSRQTPSQPFVLRPEDRVASELQPPMVPRHTPPSQPVVSFAPGTEVQRPRGPRRSPDRRSGFQFRCPRCKVMVTADENMACPRCGTSAPRVSMTVALPDPAAVARGSGEHEITVPRRGVWPLRIAIVLILGLVAAVAGPPLMRLARDRSESVAGQSTSPHLGARLTFPSGWRHQTDADQAPSAALGPLQAVISDALSLRSSRYFRDGAELLLVVAARPTHIDDAAFAGWAESVAATPETLAPTLRDVFGRDVRLSQCTANAGLVRCSGVNDGDRALAYVWGVRTATVVALFTSTASVEAASAEADELVAGLDIK